MLFRQFRQATTCLLKSFHVMPILNIYVNLKLRFDRGVLSLCSGAREQSQQSQSQTANWLTNYIRETGFDVKIVLGFVLWTCMRCHKHKLIYIVPIEDKNT